MPSRIKQLCRAGWMIASLGVGALRAEASIPDWLRAASQEAVPHYPSGVQAVMLRNEQTTTVKNNGEVTTVYRCAYKILGPEGRRHGVIRIYYDSETRIASIRGWSIPSTGGAYEVTEKDAADAILFSGNLYEDTRQKVLKIPAAVRGAVIGYEYEQRRRPYVFQDEWWFQREVPVLQARFQLRLPPGWKYREYWANHATVPVQSAGPGQFAWEVRDIPAIQEEPAMPAWETLAGRLLLAYAAPNGGGSLNSWAEVGQWYGRLAAERRQAGPEVRQKVKELTAGISDPVAKIQILASFVQQEVRYVAIEVGIGGYQPHPATEIFKNRYGDCKDKATLLSAMLDEAGIESYYVLINTRRGVVIPEFPLALVFDHAIIAIRLPAAAAMTRFEGSMLSTQMGPLLFFDPTDTYIPFGHLPAELQANYGLVVGNSGGDLTTLPSQPAGANDLKRTAKMQLAANGDLKGKVRETRHGNRAFEFRAAWLNASEADRRKLVQALFGRRTTVELNDISVQGLEKPEDDFVLDFSFRFVRYATPSGGLLLLNPRVFHEWGEHMPETGQRKQAVQFPAATAQSEEVEITLPDGLEVDELPKPIDADIGAVSYRSRAEIDGIVLRHSRRLEIKEVLLKDEQISAFERLNRQIAAGENVSAVLKRR